MNTNRTAIVTGASRGLGAAIAMELAAAGLKVAVNFFNSQEAADRVCEQIRGAGGVAEAFRADVRDEDQVARLVEEVRSSLGEVDTIVLNATGHQPMPSIEEQTWQSYLDQLEFFLKSPLLLLQQVLPAMKRNKFGRIVQIGSEVVELGNPQFANYVSAKGAQLGQTRSWARELAPHGITVNMVAPGWMADDKVDTSSADSKQFGASLPLRTHGSADEIGNACVFFISDLAGYVTGAYLPVTGGRITQMGA